jgi:hypothetical protein
MAKRNKMLAGLEEIVCLCTRSSPSRCAQSDDRDRLSVRMVDNGEASVLRHRDRQAVKQGHSASPADTSPATMGPMPIFAAILRFDWPATASRP